MSDVKLIVEIPKEPSSWGYTYTLQAEAKFE